MSLVIFGVLLIGGICGVFNAWRDNMASPDNTDDEFNHSGGDDYDDE